MTIPETIARAKELSAEKATEYLAVGGLFNPELMEHDKVRDMVMEFHTLLPAMANALESEHNRANKAEAEVERLRKLVEWQPIETAPKDGRYLLVIQSGQFKPGVPFFPYCAKWSAGTWETDSGDDGYYPTHWRPLPPAPSRVKTEE